MNKHLLMSKGYTLRVVSWENDADLYQTKDIKCASLEEITNLISFIKLFNSDGYGNAFEDDNYHLPLVNDLMIYHPSLLGDKYDKYASEFCGIIRNEMSEYIDREYTDSELLKEFLNEINCQHDIIDEICNYASEIVGNILGYSEAYDFRVYDNHQILYSSEDLYCEIIDDVI